MQSHVILFTVFVLASASQAEDWLVRFVDTGNHSGLTRENIFGGRDRKTYILETTGNGVAILDIDGDGDNDILIPTGTVLNPKSSGPGVHVYLNDGKGNFTDRSADSGFSEQEWAQGICGGDYNNDGRADVLITHFGTDRLYRNIGGGKFKDATAEANLPIVKGGRYGAGCTFFDYDRDGWLDLFVTNYVDFNLATAPKPGSGPECEWKGLKVMCGPRGLKPGASFLFHNRGDGTFEDVSLRMGITAAGRRFGLGVVAADFNDDGWPDIYVACDMNASMLFENKAGKGFVERGVPAGVAYNYNGALQAGMGVAVADYDGDGRLDIAKTNFSGDLPSLFHNEDGTFFSDESQRAGLAANQLLGWGAVFIDADEDGWPDLVIANGHVYPEVEGSNIGETYRQRSLIYRNQGNAKFADMTAKSGPAFEALRPARGMASGDLDGDGRPEIVIVNMNAAPSLLHNTGPRGNFLHVRLEGAKQKSAIGARVTVESGTRRQMQELMSGGSFYSQNELGLHYGLGSADRVTRLEVRWPDGSRQEWKDVPANRKILIRQGALEIDSIAAPQ